MRGFNLIKPDTRIPFVRARRVFFVVSALLIAASVGLFAAHGLNYGIDFRGGLLIEIKTAQPADLARMRSDLSRLDLGDVSLQTFGAPTEVLIRVQRQDGGEEAQKAATDAVRSVLAADVEYRRVEFVGPKVSEELFWSGVNAVGLAILAMLIYIWFRFEWQFSVGAVAALTHDVLATIGVFALTQMEFNLSTVAAVLTIAGYSINDTVVVFDRVRENLRRYKSKPLPDLLNRSINETLSRTVMTSGTTLIALLALYFLGGEVIRGFSFAMIFGILIGTYSSICVAVPLLLYMRLPRRGGDLKEGGSADRAAEGA